MKQRKQTDTVNNMVELVCADLLDEADCGYLQPERLDLLFWCIEAGEIWNLSGNTYCLLNDVYCLLDDQLLKTKKEQFLYKCMGDSLKVMRAKLKMKRGQ